VGAAPDFLWGLLALMNFMRFSLMKDALASLIGAACKKSGSPHRFRPRYALANLDWHPSFSFGVTQTPQGGLSWSVSRAGEDSFGNQARPLPVAESCAERSGSARSTCKTDEIADKRIGLVDLAPGYADPPSCFGQIRVQQTNIRYSHQPDRARY
jgi:hypothetical protein